MSAIGRINPSSALIVTPAAAVTPFPRRSTEPPGGARILDGVPYTIVEPGEPASSPRGPRHARTAEDLPPLRGAAARPRNGRNAVQLAALRAYLPQPDYRGFYVDVQV